ncbi:hypothetical protein UlMin_030341 [Ulmus minor]
MTTEKNSTSEVMAPNSHESMDSSHLPITGHKLNGKIFLQWSQSVMMFICGKGKDDYLTGVAVPPAKEDPKFKRWKAENNMVMSWLINSMNNDIGENCLLYETANEIWDAAKETYSDNENTTELFEIKGTLHDLRQGDLPVTVYFNLLTRYWRQLDMFEIHEWNCPTDGAKYIEIVEKKRVYKFLLGLNKNLDKVRGRILGMKPLLNIRETFSEVRREESRKKFMMGSQNHQSTAESSALAARGSSCQATDNRQKKQGRPCRGNHVSSEDNAKQSESSPFSKEQLELLQKMLDPILSQQGATTSNSIIGFGTLAQKGNFLSALNVKRENLSPWIVDSGASDHMTGDASIFHTYKPCSNNFTVRIADGSLSKVAGTGSVVISKNLTLDSVLLDLGLGNMIGSAEVCSGLYILKVNNHPGE